MKFRKLLIAVLLMPLCALTVTGCAEAGGLTFPNASDLTATPKEQLTPDHPAMSSDVEDEKYKRRLEAWGESECSKVARLCRFHRALGMPIECAPIEDKICTVGPEAPS